MSSHVMISQTLKWRRWDVVLSPVRFSILFSRCPAYRGDWGLSNCSQVCIMYGDRFNVGVKPCLPKSASILPWNVLTQFIDGFIHALTCQYNKDTATRPAPGSLARQRAANIQCWTLERSLTAARRDGWGGEGGT